MPAFFAGLATLILLVFGGRALAGADPRKLAALLRKGAGAVLLVLALFLLVRGVIVFAIPLAVVALGLLGLPPGSWFGGGNPGGGNPFGGNPFGGGVGRKSPGQKSSVRTDSIFMELDHDSGEMEGTCLVGKFAGRTLSSLSDRDLLVLVEVLQATDNKGAVLVEAYLDRYMPDWRERQADDARGRASRGGRSAAMSRDEAYDALGLNPGASEEEIRAAHRKLMMKVHPDQGGSDYLAARINQAKDVLLGGS